MRVLMIGAVLLAGCASAASAQGSLAPVRVFFDWGKPELTQDGTATLDAFAASYRGQALKIVGNSDRSGPAVLNRRGAYLRAIAVRDYLAGKGVATSSMTVASNGEDMPLVPTEDGVREVQNRRVEIFVLP